MKKFIGVFGAVLLIILDQITKVAAESSLSSGKVINVINNVFELSYVKNTGAAWGMMSNATILLAIVSIVISAAIIYFYWKLPSTKRFLPLSIILLGIVSGAVGNLIDRIFRGYVIDFLYFKLIDFPVFNVADCYVTISGVLLAIFILFYYKDDEFDFIRKKNDSIGD